MIHKDTKKETPREIQKTETERDTQREKNTETEKERDGERQRKDEERMRSRRKAPRTALPARSEEPNPIEERGIKPSC